MYPQSGKFGAQATLQSPKFKFLQSELKSVFSIHLLKDEWKKRTRSQIRKQLIFDPVEYRDLNDKIDLLSSRICKEVLTGTYSVRQPKRFLLEKSKGLCRQMTLIHPRDLLVMERLSRSIYLELRTKAPSKSAFFEPDDGNFLKGITQDDLQYGSFASWKKFQRQIFGFAKENNYIVVTDVANFYDFINFQHLRNIVASLADIRESILDLLIYILNRLTWTPDFMPLTQVGMPQIETTATRVLANAMLYEVDKVCEHSSISNYARFMDDMDIGVDTIADAKIIIRDVDLTLQSRQLRLNSSKTKILSKTEAFEHFCIRENQELTRLDAIFEKRRIPALARTILLSKYETWLDRTAKGGVGENSRFRKGNGPKIHKRILSLIFNNNLFVPDDDLLWLIKNDPAMRAVAYRYLSRSSRLNANFNYIYKMLKSRVFVDDASIVELSNYLIHSRLKRTPKCTRQVLDVCHVLQKRSDIGLHASIFISKKFLDRNEILRIINQNRDRIAGDFWLCRAAAGACPIFWQTPEWDKFNDTINEIDSEDAYDVVAYFKNISTASSFSTSLSSYMRAKNDTFSQKIYFPKVLILLAAHKNPAAFRLYPGMHATHPALRGDPYFHMMGF